VSLSGSTLDAAMRARPGHPGACPRGRRRGALDRAEEDRRHATIRSPIRGIVLSATPDRRRRLLDLNLGSAKRNHDLGDVSVYVEGQVDEAAWVYPDRLPCERRSSRFQAKRSPGDPHRAHGPGRTT
jgi:hypothetical protein